MFPTALPAPQHGRHKVSAASRPLNQAGKPDVSPDRPKGVQYATEPLDPDYNGRSIDSVTVTVTDDDGPPTGITLTVDADTGTGNVQDSLAEDGGAKTVRITAALTGGTTFATARTVQVEVGTDDDSATEGTDYTAVSRQDITINAGATSGHKDFTLTPLQDTLHEANETIGLAASLGDFTADASITLADDDAAPTGITLTVDADTGTGNVQDSLAEDGGAKTVRITATLTGSTTYGEDKAVQVEVGGGTATEGADYAAVGTQEITIDATTTSGHKDFTLTPTDDDIAEGPETISITGTLSGVTVAPASISLTDDDTAGLAFNPNAVSMGEGATGSYTVVLTSEPTADVTVTISGQGGSTDLTLDTDSVQAGEQSTLTFTAANWDQAQTITLTAADDADGADDMITLSHAPTGGGYGSAQNKDLTVTITDDENDTTAPSVTSIARHSPDASPTNADTLTWKITFSEPVTGVDAADFTLTGTTATLAVAGSGAVRDVTASGGNLAGLEGTVTLAFASGHSIEDANTNRLTDTAPTSDTNESSFLLDNTAPTVTIAGLAGTISGPVTITITFDEEMKDFDVTDITVGNGTRSNFTNTAAGTTWTVRITPGVNGAAVTADVVAGAATDLAGNDNIAAPQASAAYTTTLGAPANFTATAGDTEVVLAWEPPAGNTGSAALTKYQVRFQEGSSVSSSTSWSDVADGDDAGADLDDETAFTVTGLTNGTEYAFELQAVNSAGDGTPATATATPASSDTAAPLVTSIVRQTPSSSPTNEDSLTWRVTFNEAVQNVDGADFQVSDTTATLAVARDGAANAWDVTASGGNLASLTATVTLGFAAGQDIEDESGNDLTNTAPTSGTNENTFVVDNTAPTVTITGLAGTITGAVTATFTFDETVTGFAAADITVGNGAASAFTETATGTVWTALITPDMNGTDVTVDVGAGAAEDEAGNPNTAAPQARATYTVPPPGLPQAAFAAAASSVAEGAGTQSVQVELNPAAPAALTLAYTVTGSASAGGDFTIQGAGSLAINAGASSADIQITIIDDATQEGAETVILTLSAGTGYTLGSTRVHTITINDDDQPVANTAPTVANAIPDQAATEGTAFSYVFPAGTFTDADGDSLTYSAGALPSWLSFNAAARRFAGTPQAGDTGTVSVTVTADDGNGGSVSDSFDITVSADTAPPRLVSVTRQSPATSPTDADSLTWRVTFNEAVTGVDGADFTITGAPATTASITAVAGAGNARDVTASGGDLAGYTGTVTLAFKEGHDIQDEAGNALAANPVPTGANDNTFVVDNTAAALPAATPWLARFGRSVAEQALDGIAGRAAAPRQPGLSGTLAGQAPAPPGQVPEGEDRQLSMTASEALLGTRASLTSVEGGLAFWLRAALAGWDGQEGAGMLDGETTSIMLGADHASGDWLIGMALLAGKGRGAITEDGETTRMQASLAAAIPYGSYDFSERLRLWAAIGHGGGKITTGKEKARALSWSMAAAGMRSQLSSSLHLTSDALWTRTAAGDAATTSRLRAGIEGGWSLPLEGGARLEPRLGLGLRHDGGDAETGLGIEVGAGIGWTDPARGLSLNLAGRRLIAHDDAGRDEWGMAARLGWDPAPETARGPSVSMRQELGGDAEGGMAALFAPQLPEGGGDAGMAPRTEIEAAFGLPAIDRRFTAIPHAGCARSGDGHDCSLGWRLQPEAAAAPEFTFDSSLTRRQDGGGDVRHLVGALLVLRW